MTDMTLPAFEMDCRDWIVVSPTEAGLPEDLSGAPVLAVLSTMVIEEDILEATGALTVGIIEDEDDIETRPLGPGCSAFELLDFDTEPNTRRYVMPAPDHQLALVAEFVVAGECTDELDRRVNALMTSFKWQAAA